MVHMPHAACGTLITGALERLQPTDTFASRRHHRELNSEAVQERRCRGRDLEPSVERCLARYRTLLEEFVCHQADLTREIHLQEEVVEYGAKIAALERKIGQLTMELDVMKKRALIRPSQQGARPSIISGPGASPSDGDVAS